MASGEEFRSFAEGRVNLTGECKNCDFLPYCYGGCQRYRGLPGGPEGKSYLCGAYRYFLSRNLEKIKELDSWAKRQRGSVH
ncbi:SPASM domain-containing protein [Candidatus Bipolaricaulota bacterium]|nr:SPASM domain-containing protein [Candidatus Bipolaricaulota bacterium]